MFYYIKGAVAHIGAQLAVIDCGGVGYACHTTTYTLSALRAGETAKLYTYCNIREDAFDIYGFSSESEKNCFEMLISVSGVGPRAALSILSATTPEALAMAIISEDTAVLTMAPGIGKKIAQRIVLELKDKLAKEGYVGATLPSGAVVAAPGSALKDAQAALSVLGYSPGDIAAALRDIDIETLGLEDIVREALKKMLK